MNKALLPPFDDSGILPPGDYMLTLDELKRSVLVEGPADKARVPNWDQMWRKNLVENLEVLIAQLWQVRVGEIFIDSSFVEEKEHPNDIDGYFECELQRLASGELQRELNLLDPHHIWTWDPATRRPYRGYAKRQLPMWHAYRIELYPHYGQLSGIRDDRGYELEFPSAFRRSRDGRARGIVKIGGSP